MLKLYEKSPLGFAIGWIVLYCLTMSAGDALSAMLGVEKAVTLPIGAVASAVLLLFLAKERLFQEYGICPPTARPRAMLYYLPLLLLVSSNLWFGAVLNYSVPESVLWVLTMVCVGFLEELIFRGLLFGAMRGDNPIAAVIVSSLTFGIGHIINLMNGAELVSTLLQLLYATAAGFMFVMIYVRSGSLVPCIAGHVVFNALGVFAHIGKGSEQEILSAVIITLLSGGYALYLALTADDLIGSIRAKDVGKKSNIDEK